MACAALSPDRPGAAELLGGALAPRRRCASARACCRGRRAGSSAHSTEAPPGCVTRPRRAARSARSKEDAGIKALCPHGRGGGVDAQAGGHHRARHARARRRAGAGARGASGDRRHRRLSRPRTPSGGGPPASGEAPDGMPLAWNLVSGRQRPAERLRARRLGRRRRRTRRRRSRFAETCRAIRCRTARSCTSSAEAERRRRENLLIVRSDYRAPFGSFYGNAARRHRACARPRRRRAPRALW